MKRFFLKLFFVSSPILLVLAVYLYKDPFKVLYHYDCYYPANGIQYVELNKDVVSTETFVNNYKQQQYDSYIFGSSRSLRYQIAEWQKHINSKKCFHFDAYSESLLGIEKKISFLHDKGIHIKNALLILDDDILSKTQSDKSHFLIMDPKLSGQNELSFQFTYLKTFLDPEFLLAYIRFICSKKMDLSKKGWRFFEYEVRRYDPITNELYDSGLEAAIKNNRDSFYTSRKRVFYERGSDQKYSPSVIRKKQKELLMKIKEILNSDQTNYRIVISPLYDQLKIDSTDINYLYSEFGKEHVYDFSGINDMTQSIYNYYENSHYRPFIATRVMDSIYVNKVSSYK